MNVQTKPQTAPLILDTGWQLSRIGGGEAQEVALPFDVHSAPTGLSKAATRSRWTVWIVTPRSPSTGM